MILTSARYIDCLFANKERDIWGEFKQDNQFCLNWTGVGSPVGPKKIIMNISFQRGFVHNKYSTSHVKRNPALQLGNRRLTSLESLNQTILNTRGT